MSIINSSNKKFAVLIGINYVGTSSELNGCINDALHLKTFLTTKCGYLPENILMLADDGVNQRPTKQNILNSFNVLINKATNEQFTELWLSYSGHGSYETDKNADENDGRDEVLCPVDYATAGMIVDDYIYTNFICKLPQTATLFSIMDCCHSGTVYDLPCLYTQAFTVNNTNNKHVAKVISISGCRDDQTSADAYINKGYEGAMTWSFLNALANVNYNIKLVDLVKNMRVLLAAEYTQVPMLAVSSNDQYDRTLIDLTIISPTPTPTPIVPIVVAPVTKPIKFKLTVDYWYKESSWNVLSVVDNKYVFPTFNVFTYKYQIAELTKNLLPGTYKLCIKDTYGDGGVKYLVSDGLLSLTTGKMTSGKLAEYTFTV